MKATYGTGCFMLLHTGERLHVSRSRLLTTIASRIDGQTAFALEGALFIAGAAIQWINEGLGVQGGPKAVEALAMQARPDHGVILAPAFTGLGAPWWDADARGAILGLTRDSGLPDICAAAFYGCALQTRDLIEAMRADAPDVFADGAALKIDGGMASSAFFRQRLADLTGLGVQPAQTLEATALGAALFAGIGSGVYASPADALAAQAEQPVIQPTLDHDAREAAYGRWLDAIGRIRSQR
jgi:glycerol kinase